MADEGPEDLSVAIVVNLARFEKSLAGIEASAKRILNRMEKNLHAKIGVQIDTKSAQESAMVLERELDKMRAKFDPVFAASKRYELQVAELAQAHRLGALNAVQYQAALESLNVDYTKTALPEAKTDVTAEALDRLRSKYDPLYAASERYKKSLDEINQLQKAGALTADQYQNALNKIQDDFSSANNSAANKLADDLERLRTKFDPIYAATKQYDAAVLELSQALETGAIDAQRYQSELDRLTATLNKKIGGTNADEAAKELERLRTEFDPLYAASKRYEQQFLRLEEAHERGALTTKQYQGALERLNAEFAKNSGPGLKTFSTDQLDSMRAKFDPLFAASKRYENQVEELDNAMRAGAITQKQYDAALQKINQTFQKNYTPGYEVEIEQLRREFDHAYVATREFEAGVERLNRAMREGIVDADQYQVELNRLSAERLAYVAEESHKASRRLGMGVQNASYQIADFAVQVGSGTTAARALGQQLPQVLGGFGAWGAAAGAAVAIAIPLVAWLLKSEDSAKNVDEAFERSSNAMSAWRTSVEAASIPLVELTNRYGELGEAIYTANQNSAAFAQRATLISNMDLGKSLIKDLGGVDPKKQVRPDGLAGVASTLAAGLTQGETNNTVSELERAIDRLEKKFKFGEQSARDFAAGVESLSNAKTPDAQLAVVSDLIATFQSGTGNEKLAQLAGDTQSWYNQLLKVHNELIELRDMRAVQLIDSNDSQFLAIQKNVDDLAFAFERLDQARRKGDSQSVGQWNRVIESLKNQRGELTLNEQKITELVQTLDSYDAGLDVLGYDENTDIRTGIQETTDKLIEAIGELDNMDAIQLDNLSGEVDGLTERLGRFLGQIGQTKEGLQNLGSTHFEEEYVRQAAAGAGSNNEELVRAVVALADRMGLAAEDLLTVMSYETGGDFRTDKFGGKDGKYLGLIQFSPDNQAKYGIGPNSSITEQVIATGKYLEDAGVKAGDSLLRVYTAIQTGNPDDWWKSDSANGGAPGNVRDKVNNQMGGHRERAQGLLSAYSGVVQEVTNLRQAQEGFNDTLEDGQRNLQLQNDVLGKNLYETTYLTKQTELLNAARSSDVPVTDGYMRQINAQAEAAANLAVAQEKQRQLEQQTEAADEAQRNWNLSIDEGNRNVELQTSLLGKNAYETAYLTKQAELRNKALADGIPPSDELNAQIEEQAVAAGNLAAAQARQQEIDAQNRKGRKDDTKDAERALEIRERLAKQVEEDISRSELETEIMGMSAPMQARLIKQFEILSELKRQNIELDSEMLDSGKTWAQWAAEVAEASGVAVEANERHAESVAKSKEATDFLNQANADMKNGLLDAIVAGEGLAETLDNIAAMLLKAALQAALFNEGPFSVAGAGKGILGGVFDSVMGAIGLGSEPTGNAVPGTVNALPLQSPNTLAASTPSLMMQSQPMNININMEGANGDRTIADIAKRSVMQGLGEYDKRLPGRVRNIQSKPRDL